MLEQLVESNGGRKIGRSGFLLTTTVLVFSLFASGILWSMFAKDLGINENSDLSKMVTPVSLPEDEKPPEPVKQIKQEQTQKVENDVAVRQVNMARVDEPFVPDDVSTVQNTVRERPNTNFKIGKIDEDPVGNSSSASNEGRKSSGSEVTGIKEKQEKSDPEDIPPPTIKKKEDTPKVASKPTGPIKVSELLNGRATSLPVPAYPAPAKAVRASGNVNVQVTIDEQGRVISASAVGGHALLKQAAENAARGARFTPTILNGQPVKVTGLIVYKFAMQ